jgi:hypothetical protein
MDDFLQRTVDPRQERRETYHAIRQLLLSNCDLRGESLCDDTGRSLRLTEEGNLSERTLVAALGKSRIPIREALTVLRTVGTIALRPDVKRYEVTLVDCSGSPENIQLEKNIRYELLSNGRSAISRFVESVDPSERDRKLSPLREKLDQARELSKKNSNAGCCHTRAVLAVTDSLSDLAASTGLHRAADAIQSCLDIIEISTVHARVEPTPASIEDRIRGCSQIYDCITQSADDRVVIDNASREFGTYVQSRVEQLQAACRPPAALKKAG